MKKRTKETTRKKGEKERRGNERENDGGTSCSAGNAACGSSSRTDCAWCGAKEGSIPGILKHHQCARCKLTFYCSRNCQRRHWREGGHKQSCVAPADRRASAALDAARIITKEKSEQGHSQSVKASAAGGKGTTGGDDIKQNKGKKKSKQQMTTRQRLMLTTRMRNVRCALKVSLLLKSSVCRARMHTMRNAWESYESSESSRCVRYAAPIFRRGRSSCAMMQRVDTWYCIVGTIRALLTHHGA